jgi:Leucine-rich repeat (LRR) protein
MTDEDDPKFDRYAVAKMIVAGQRLPLSWRTQVEELSFDDLDVADIAPLADLVNLRRLNLVNTRVADLTPLAGLANLQKLYLSGTRVSNLVARFIQIAG